MHLWSCHTRWGWRNSWFMAAYRVSFNTYRSCESRKYHVKKHHSPEVKIPVVNNYWPNVAVIYFITYRQHSNFNIVLNSIFIQNQLLGSREGTAHSSDDESTYHCKVWFHRSETVGIPESITGFGGYSNYWGPHLSFRVNCTVSMYQCAWFLELKMVIMHVSYQVSHPYQIKCCIF